MGQQSGLKTNLLMGDEATYGAGGSSGRLLAFYNANFTYDQPRDPDQDLLDGRPDGAEPADGLIECGLSLEVPPDTLQLGWLFRAAFGAPVTASNGGGLYTHLFNLSNAALPSHWFEDQLDQLASARYLQYLGFKCNSLAFSVTPAGRERFTFGWMGQRMLKSNASYDASPTAVSINLLGNTLCALTEGGSSLANGASASLNVANDMDGDTYVLGQAYRSALNEGKFAVTGSLRVLLTGDTVLGKALAGTESSLKWTWTKATHSLTIEAKEIQYAGATSPISGPRGRALEGNWKAYFKDGANPSALQITLVNDVASYA